MNTIAEKTVREIALENPASVRVFESLGIDYCCGGKRALSEACTHAGMDVERVRDLLDEAARGSEAPEDEPWKDARLSALIAHIVEKHHDFVRRETPRLQSLFSKVVARHGDAHPEVAQIESLFSAMGQDYRRTC